MAIPFTVDNLRAEGLDNFRSPLMRPLLLGTSAVHAIADPTAHGQQSLSRATGH